MRLAWGPPHRSKDALRFFEIPCMEIAPAQKGSTGPILGEKRGTARSGFRSPQERNSEQTRSKRAHAEHARSADRGSGLGKNLGKLNSDATLKKPRTPGLA